MENEFNILQNINNNDDTTQRELAKKTGMSLGNVNILLKRLISKGLVKIEHLNARSMKYILTPKGLQEKARLTYNYIVNSYNYISRIEQLIQDMLAKANVNNIYLYGKEDEIYSIITNSLINSKVKYERFKDITILKEHYVTTNLIITWSPEHTQQLAENNIDSINILNVI